MSDIRLVSGIGIALGFFLGILAHEYAHHRVADLMGDRTPRLNGRVTFSPKAHFDPVGSLVVPIIFVLTGVFSSLHQPVFGWGKRHALSARSMRGPARTTVIVSLAGPAATLLVAIVAGAVYRGAVGQTLGPPSRIAEIAAFVAVVNAYLTVIDLLPIPGRDGGRILARFLSPAGAMKMEDLVQYEILFLLVLVAFLGSVVVGMTNPVLDLVLGTP